MASFVARRVLWTFPILLVVLTVTFFMVRSIAGDPFRPGPLAGAGTPGWTKANDYKPPSIQANLERKFGLDLPWYEQYVNYLEGVATFEFGLSTVNRQRAVDDILREQAPNSALLGGLAFALALAVGIPLGTLAALRQGSAADVGVRVLTLGGLAIPVFLVGTVSIWLFALRLGWLPTSGWAGGWRPKVLPVVTLSLLPASYVLQLARAGVLAVLGSDHVRAARAKGLRRGRIVLRHVLPGALVPVLAAAGPMLGVLVTGSFAVETIFSIPGIGRYYVSAVIAKDMTVVLGITVVLTIAVVAANLLFDVVHALVDPRAREAGVREAGTR